MRCFGIVVNLDPKAFFVSPDQVARIAFVKKGLAGDRNPFPGVFISIHGVAIGNGGGMSRVRIIGFAAVGYYFGR